MSKVEWWLGGGGMDFHISRLSLWWTLCYVWLVRLYVSIGTSLVDVWCLKLSYIFMPCDKNALWCLLIFSTKSMETLELMCGNSATCGEFGHKLWRLRRLCHLFSCFRFLVSITCHRITLTYCTTLLHPTNINVWSLLLCAHWLEKSILKFKISWHTARGSFICLYCAYNDYGYALFNEDLSMLSSITKKGETEEYLGPLSGFWCLMTYA
jgi:hypothetical protein